LPEPEQLPDVPEAEPLSGTVLLSANRGVAVSTGQLKVHPLRSSICEEVHARPFPVVAAPMQISHIGVLAGEGGKDVELNHLRELCRRFHVEYPPDHANHFSQNFGDFHLRWERHTEFFTYSVTCAKPIDRPFDRPPISLLPVDWLATMNGEVVSAVHVAFLPRTVPELAAEERSKCFDEYPLIASRVVENSATIWTAFRVHADGFVRILVHDISLYESRAGRLIQRLLELETYRLMALLTLPIAREIGPQITAIEQRLVGVTDSLAQFGVVSQEKSLLHDLSMMSAEIEHIRAQRSYRFGAAKAYHALVRRRLEELRETQILGTLTLAEFLDRRMSPAMRTCETVSERLEDLSRRIDRASDLLRTRIDLTLELQNQELLSSMNHRAHLQLRLQQTVEGLSVVAVSYYVLGLLRYAFDGLKEAGSAIHPGIAEAIALPFVLLAVYLGVRRVRRITHQPHDATKA